MLPICPVLALRMPGMNDEITRRLVDLRADQGDAVALIGKGNGVGMGFCCTAQYIGDHPSEITLEIVSEGSVERGRTICMAGADSGIEIEAEVIWHSNLDMIYRQFSRCTRVLMTRSRQRIENERTAVAITRKIPTG